MARAAVPRLDSEPEVGALEIGAQRYGAIYEGGRLVALLEQDRLSIVRGRLSAGGEPATPFGWQRYRAGWPNSLSLPDAFRTHLHAHHHQP